MKKKILFIVSRKHIRDAICRIKQMQKSETYKILILQLNDFSSKDLGNLDVEVLKLDKYLKFQSMKEFHDAFAIIQKIENGTLTKKGKISDSIRYDGVSLFDLMKPSFLIFNLADIIRQFCIAANLINIENPVGIIIFCNLNNLFSLRRVDSSVMLSEAVRLIAQSKGISCSVSKYSVPYKKYQLIAKANFILRTIRHHFMFLKSITISRKGCRGLEDKNGILFVNHARPHAYANAAVIKELKKDPNSKTDVIQVSHNGRKVLDDEDISYHLLNTYSFFLNPFKIIKIMVLINNQLKHITKLKFWDQFDYEGVGIGSFLKADFFYFVMTQAFTAIESINFFNKIFDRTKPSVTVGLEDRGIFHGAHFFVAKKYGIPSLLIQVGLYGSHPLYKFDFVADKIAVEGSAVKQTLDHIGHDPANITVTGQPKYDYIKENFANLDKKRICAKFRVDSHKLIILYASQNLQEETSPNKKYISSENTLRHYKELLDIYEEAGKLNNAVLISKPHPNEDENLHKMAIEESRANNTNLVRKTENIYELLSISDIVICRSSTVGLEAIILGKNLLIVNLLDDIWDLPFVEYGAAIGAYDKSEILPSINRLLQDSKLKKTLSEGRKKIIKEFAFDLDGRSGGRIADVILSMIRH